MLKFADEVLIEVASGKGGDGSVAMRREKYVPRGGPAGGDGGRGGDLIFVVKRNLRTLAHLRYQRKYLAEHGQNGMSKSCHGRDGQDMIVPVPPGSLIKDPETGEILKDFSSEEGTWLFLKGGNGGWGNIHFKSSTNQAPDFAQSGKPALRRQVLVELNIMADIGLVGFPNAGKSSLLDAFTMARPKIAPYPFTTKIPNLGVLSIFDRDIVIADIPGIIEGAHLGHGLGLRFLKHISRTVALAFLVDLGEDTALSSFPILLRELEGFNPELARKPRLLIGTKLDLPGAKDRFEALKTSFPNETCLAISVADGQGLPELKRSFFQFLPAEPPENKDNGNFLDHPEWISEGDVV